MTTDYPALLAVIEAKKTRIEADVASVLSEIQFWNDKLRELEQNTVAHVDADELWFVGRWTVQKAHLKERYETEIDCLEKNKLMPAKQSLKRVLTQYEALNHILKQGERDKRQSYLLKQDVQTGMNWTLKQFALKD